MTWKLYAVVSAGAFVATYLVSSPALEDRRPPASQPAPSSRPSATETDIEALAARLHVRQPVGTGYRTPGRDPFRFQPKATKPTMVAAPAPRPLVEAPAPAPVLPVLTLSGIASDVVDGKPLRSAVLSAPAGVLIAREGESVAGLYTVVAIGEESIELEATADGSRRTLRLGK